jgi:hypothetical protein
MKMAEASGVVELEDEEVLRETRLPTPWGRKRRPE